MVKLNERRLLKRATALGIVGALAIGVMPAAAQGLDEEGRAAMLQIPGVGTRTPTDADWRAVGEMTLGPTKATIAEGECTDVELSFMGLNNQNLHNMLFRGFLQPWEEYTGATIKWIDLAQADYNARLQQGIATGTVDFDILEMGAPFEGDTAGRGLLDPMPEWVAEQVDMDDYVDYLKAPVGTWDGETYRISIDGDTHSFGYRTDYYESEELAAAWAAEGDGSEWAVPTSWEQVNAHSKFLAGKKDPQTGQAAHGFLDPLKYGWGGFGFYFLGDRAAAYAKHPADPAWLFDAEDMTPRVNNPAWVQAIQDVIDLKNTEGAYPSNQIGVDPNDILFVEWLFSQGAMISWWGDHGSVALDPGRSTVGDVVAYSINPGAEKVYNSQAGEWEVPADGINFAPNNAYIGWGVYVTNSVSDDELKRKCTWSAAAHLGGKDISLWMSMYPSGFQPYRNSHFNVDEWEAAGYDRDYTENYLAANLDSYNHPNAAIEPRIPGIFQYYSSAEDELALGLGNDASAQEIADNIAAAWEEITDQIGRDSQVALYRASLGLE